MQSLWLIATTLGQAAKEGSGGEAAGGGFGLVEYLRAVVENPLALTVVLALFIMSLVSLAIGVERWWVYRRMRRVTLDFLPAVKQALMNRDLKAALEETRRHRFSHLAKVLAGGLHEFINHEEQKHDFDLIMACERSLERSSALTTAELRRGMGALATIASSAPFVGLLGTVNGVIRAFTGMAETGGGGLAGISKGIAEALYTTALGLIVAIPALWLYNYFSGRVEYFQVEMTNSASELLDYFMKRIGRGAQAPSTARH